MNQSSGKEIDNEEKESKRKKTTTSKGIQSGEKEGLLPSQSRSQGKPVGKKGNSTDKLERKGAMIPAEDSLKDNIEQTKPPKSKSKAGTMKAGPLHCDKC